MIAAGINTKALSTYMGHSTITITLDRYGHLLPGNEHEAATLLDRWLAKEGSSNRRQVGRVLSAVARPSTLATAAVAISAPSTPSSAAGCVGAAAPAALRLAGVTTELADAWTSARATASIQVSLSGGVRYRWRWPAFLALEAGIRAAGETVTVPPSDRADTFHH